MIKLLFKDFHITLESKAVQQFDNLTIPVVVDGLTEGYDWHLYLEHSGHLDMIQLIDGQCTLTADNLAFSGAYQLEVRGSYTEGDEIATRHTNTVTIIVPL